MIIYNVTTKVANDIVNAWLDWMKSEHIPEVISTGCFTRATILHLLEADDDEGTTYAVQFHAESKALYNTYIDKHAGEMRKKSLNKWGDKTISFRTLMQVVN